VCGGEVDTADHDINYIAACEDCGLKYDVNIDMEWDDEMWRNLNTVRLLLALPAL
jgi:hypothetical protein